MRLRELLHGRSTSLHHQVLRSIVSGGAATVADVGVLALLVSGLGWHYLLGNVLSYTVGTAVNYTICITWVFSNRSVRHPAMEFLIFAVIGVGGVGISSATMYGLVEGLEIHYMVAKLMSIVLQFVWNFGSRKLLLFREPKTAELRRDDAK